MKGEGNFVQTIKRHYIKKMVNRIRKMIGVVVITTIYNLT